MTLIDTNHPPRAAQHRIRQLTTNGKVGNAALSPDGKSFAYTVDDLGQKSLWLGFVDGGNHIQLREPAEATIRSLTFSPDGRELFFLLRDDKNPQTGLFKMRALGGVPTKVQDGVGNFRLSADGTQLALVQSDAKQGREVIVITPLDGSAKREIVSFPPDFPLDAGTLSWSADGKRLAVAALLDTRPETGQLAVVEIATGLIEKIPHRVLHQINKTAWLSDGSGLIVVALEMTSKSSVPLYRVFSVGYPGGEMNEVTPDRSNYGESWHNDAGVSLSLSGGSDRLLTVEHRQLSNIWVAPIDDLSSAKQITFGSFGKYDGLWGMDWTPDDRLVVTTSDTESQYIASMNSDGTGQIPLTSPGDIDGQITVSKDGRFVLFQSNRTSIMDIWRVDRDGANLKQLTFIGKAFHPAPSPDGRWVYFKSGVDGRGALFRVPMDGGEPEPVTSAETSWVSFSPDGRYFSATYRTDKVRLAIFSAATHEVIKQFDLPKGGTLYMGSRWTPDSQAVTFRDKNHGYWIQPIDGGDARRLDGLPKERLYNFSWSRDGKWLAFVRGPEIRDVVLIESVRQ